MIDARVLSLISDMKSHSLDSSEVSTMVMTDVNDVLSPRVELIYPQEYDIHHGQSDVRLLTGSQSVQNVELVKSSSNDIDVLTLNEPGYFSSIRVLNEPYVCRSSLGHEFAVVDCSVSFTRRANKKLNDQFVVRCSIVADLDRLNVQDRVYVYFDNVTVNIASRDESRFDAFTHKMIASGLASAISGRVSFDTPSKSIKTGFGMVYPTSVEGDSVEMSRDKLRRLASVEAVDDRRFVLDRMISRGPIAGRDDVTIDIIDHQYVINTRSKRVNDYEAMQLEEYILSGAADEVSRLKKRGLNV